MSQAENPGPPGTIDPGCSIPDARIDDLLAGRLTLAEEDALYAHAEGCPACETRLFSPSIDPRIIAELARPLPVLATARTGTVATTAPPNYPWLDSPFPDHPDDAGSLDGRFRVVREVGRGGFGIVFLAYDRLGQKLALKVLAPPDGKPKPGDEGRRVEKGRGTKRKGRRSRNAARQSGGPEKEWRKHYARFEREAQAGVVLKEVPQFVAVQELVCENRVATIVMEYVEGATLSSLFGKPNERGIHSRLAPDRAAAVALEIASGLAAIHGLGWVHQDIKPANIIIQEAQSGGSARPRRGGLFTRTPEPGVRILDLGFAFQPGGPVARAPVVSEGYASPEQRRPDRVVGPPSDVYSLGAVLFEMLTGEQVTMLGEAAVRERLKEAHAPGRLANLCAACLQKEPERRPSADQAARALRWYRLRHRVRAALGCLALLVVAAAVFGPGLYRDYTARRAEEVRQAQAQAHLSEIDTLSGELWSLFEERVATQVGPYRLVVLPTGELIIPRDKEENAAVRRLSDRLDERLRTFEAAQGAAPSSRTDQSVRVARATLAVARYRFDDALVQLPAETASGIAGDPARATRLERQALELRAYALECRGRWEEAARQYRALQALGGESMFAVSGLTHCLDRLGRKEDAVREWTVVINSEREAGPQPGQARTRLIVALLGRVSITADHDPWGWPDQASKDLGEIATFLKGEGKTWNDVLPDYRAFATCYMSLLSFEAGDIDKGLIWSLRLLEFLSTGPFIHSSLPINASSRLDVKLRGLLDTLQGDQHVACVQVLSHLMVDRGLAWVRYGQPLRAVEVANELIVFNQAQGVIEKKEVFGRLPTPQMYGVRMKGNIALFQKASKEGNRELEQRYLAAAIADTTAIVTYCEIELKTANLNGTREGYELGGYLGMGLRFRGILRAFRGEFAESDLDIEKAVVILTAAARHLPESHWPEQLAEAIKLRDISRIKLRNLEGLR